MHFNSMRVSWPVIKNENVKCYKSIYNCQRKKVKKSYQENQGWYLSFSVRAGVIYWLQDYFQLVYIGSNFNSVCPIREKISARFSMMKLLHVIVIPFLHCFHLSCKKKSYNGLAIKNFSPGASPAFFFIQRKKFI